jgi:LDH2 family malate/lactate/ureidoglycolate dehydrogenase
VPDKRTVREMNDKRFLPEDLYTFCSNVFIQTGFSQEDANIAANSLVQAELEGAQSHGISRLPIYAKRISEGRINNRPNIQVEETGSLLKVYGDNGLGQIVSHHAVAEGIALAKRMGMAGVFVRNSNHFGTAAFYCQQACKEKMVLVGMTNSPPGIAPWGGIKPFFGTNPIAFCFPTREDPPVIIDMSSSVVARGNIILAEKLGKSIPDGWALDEQGKETNNPQKALKGSVLPLGGAKGYALAFAIEMFSSILSGAAFGPHVNNIYQENVPPSNVGHSFILIDLESLVGLDHYFTLIDQFINEVKQVPRVDEEKEILYPGERRFKKREHNSVKGLYLTEQIIIELTTLGTELNVPFPERRVEFA